MRHTTEGTPSAFCKSGRRCCLNYFIDYDARPDQTTCGGHFRLTPFAENAKDGANVPDASKIQKRGHPAPRASTSCIVT